MSRPHRVYNLLLILPLLVHTKFVLREFWLEVSKDENIMLHKLLREMLDNTAVWRTPNDFSVCLFLAGLDADSPLEKILSSSSKAQYYEWKQSVIIAGSGDHCGIIVWSCDHCVVRWSMMCDQLIIHAISMHRTVWSSRDLVINVFSKHFIVLKFWNHAIACDLMITGIIWSFLIIY